MSTKKTSSYNGAALRLHRDERLAAQSDPAEIARRALDHHERAIESGLRSFVVIGQALHAIRTERLYVGEYSTFAEYLLVRWDLSESYVSRLIAAAHVATKALPIGMEINSEAVARELADLADDTDALRQIWDEATRRAAGGRITAALVKEVRRSLDPPKAPVVEGEVVDPLKRVPAEQAVNDFIGNQASGLVGTSPADESGEGRPATAEPGEAEGDSASSAADVPTPSATPTGDGSSPEEPQPVAPPEQDGSGVDRPAPASGPTFDEVLDEHAPDPGARVVAALEELAEEYEALDVDVIGPLLTSDDLAGIDRALNRVVAIVELLIRWNERAAA